MWPRKRKWFAPYPAKNYRKLLSKIIQIPSIQLLPFSAPILDFSNQVTVFVRHDIDTASCLRNLHSLLEIDREFNVRAGIFLRVDEKEYSLFDCSNEIQAALEQGMEIGLHSLCYVEDDYMETFKRETEKFARQIGFHPRSFNAHGLGEFRWDVRLRFYEEIADRLSEFGYQIGDIPNLRPYKYVIQDCYWDESRKARFHCDDFIRPAHFLTEGQIFLVLTHPCYWIS